MNSRQNLFVSIFTALLFVSVACNTDCTENGSCEKVSLDYSLGAAADYIHFKKGSYWIYELSSNGHKDTVYCLSDTVIRMAVAGKTSGTSHITINYDRLKASYFSSHHNWVMNQETVSPVVTSNSENEAYKVMLSHSVQNEGEIISFYYPFDRNTCSGKGSSFTCCLNADTSMKVAGKDYHHVAKFSNTSDELWCENTAPSATQNPPALFYFSKGVGLIRKQNLRDNTSWDLVEYHLN